MCDSDACTRPRKKDGQAAVVPTRDFGSFFSSNVHDLIHQNAVCRDDVWEYSQTPDDWLFLYSILQLKLEYQPLTLLGKKR